MHADKFSANVVDAASDPTTFVDQHQALFSYQTFKSEHSTFPLCLMSLPKCLCKLRDVSLFSGGGGGGHIFFPSCLGEGHNFFKVFY